MTHAMQSSSLTNLVKSIAITLAVSIILIGCGTSSEDPASDSKHILLSEHEVGLTAKVYKYSIDVCMSGVTDSELDGLVELSIKKWLRPIRELDGRVTSNVSFSCPGDIEIHASTELGRSFTRTGLYPSLYLNLRANYVEYELVHELGHAFGLGDTYEEQTYSCMPGQPASVMCNANSAFLQPDDINGIREMFKRSYGYDDYIIFAD